MTDTHQINPDEVLARLGVSPFRRLVAAGMTFALGVALVGTAMQLSLASPLVMAVLLAAGAMAFFGAVRLYHATKRDLVLTERGVFDSSGRELALMENIATVERGAFAFKPSNGFMIRLVEARPGAWVPGLWWRVGRRVGVGGTTSAKAARNMAEVIAMLKADPNFIEHLRD